MKNIIIKKWSRGGVDVCSYEQLAPTAIWTSSHKFGMALFRHVFRSEWGKRIKQYDRIIIFNYYGRSVALPILLLKKSSAKVYFWEWNTLGTVKKNLLTRMIERKIPVYTFDPKDAAINDWKFNQQFYFPSNKVGVMDLSNKKAFFVGVDKGRYSLLDKIKLSLESLGFFCDFWIVRDNTTPFNADKRIIHKNGLSYEEVLNHISECDVLLDIVKAGQEGLTLRSLEAFFYGKKIITNNAEIKKTKLYDPSRIMILNEDITQEDLRLFAYRKFIPYTKDELKEFSFCKWLNGFH